MFWCIKTSGEVFSKLKSRGFCATNLSTYGFSTLYTIFPHTLKTYLRLHKPLITFSSLEIRNYWCLMSVLHVGACGGVTELDISQFGIIQLADCFISSPFSNLRNVFYFYSVFSQLYLKENMCNLIDAI